jgi:hypothetical protein
VPNEIVVLCFCATFTIAWSQVESNQSHLMEDIFPQQQQQMMNGSAHTSMRQSRDFAAGSSRSFTISDWNGNQAIPENNKYLAQLRYLVMYVWCVCSYSFETGAFVCQP